MTQDSESKNQHAQYKTHENSASRSCRS